MNSFPLEPKTECYAWGSMGDRKIETIPKMINIETASPIIQIYAAKHVSMAVSSSGDVYSWGKGNIGRRCKSSSQNIPAQIQGIRKIDSVSLGEGHGLLRDREGNVFSFGDPSDHNLGISELKTRIKVPSPRKVPIKGNCTLVACGQTTSTLSVLKENNETDVIMFGSHKGLHRKGFRSNKTSPIRVLHTSSQVTRISSGYNHVLAVVNNFVFGWGSTENGRLGIGREISSNIIVEPVEITWFRNNMIHISDISSGSAHSIVLSEEGDVYTFGWNLYYQCGNNRKDDDLLEPSLLKHCHGQIASVHAGFGHSAAVTVDGRLLCWGFNEEGQCGVGNEENVSHPTPVDFHRDDANTVVSVSLGNTHTVAVTSSCSKSEYMYQRSLVHKMARALVVLQRFSRHVLLRLRLKRYEKDESIGSCDVEEKAQDISDDRNDGIDPIEDSESSVNSDASRNNSQAIESPIMSTSHISEIFAMQEEDELSRIFRQELNRLHGEKIKAKKRVQQEIQRRFHIAYMCKEDIRCLRWRTERILKMKESRRFKQEVEREKRLTPSHKRSQEKLNVKIQKVKKETKSVKKVIRSLPTSKRKISICHNNNTNPPDQEHIRDERPIISNSSINDLHRKRNTILLRKREARLKRQREAAEEEKKKISAQQAEQERRKQLDKEKKRMSIMKNIKKLQTNLHNSKVSTDKILSQLEIESNRLVSISDPIDLKSLRTVDEWITELNTVDNV